MHTLAPYHCGKPFRSTTACSIWAELASCDKLEEYSEVLYMALKSSDTVILFHNDD